VLAYPATLAAPAVGSIPCHTGYCVPHWPCHTGRAASRAQHFQRASLPTTSTIWLQAEGHLL